MARIACLMMQKDEQLLLRPWILYYGYLFGFENLYIYDNGSTATAIQETLNEFAGVGVHVDFSHNTPSDFEHKGVVIGEKIKEFQKADLYDVALPLDCDEFIAINGKHGFSCNKTEIIEELQRVFNGGIICRTAHCLDNRPGYFNLFRYVTHIKSIVIVNTFLGIDHGFHQATLPPEIQYGQTSLIHIHMHFKPYRQVLDGAKNKLAPYVNVNDRAAIERFNGVGNHLKKYFFMSDIEFYSELHGYQWPLIRFMKFQELLSVFCDFAELKNEWEFERPTGLSDNLLVIDIDKNPFIESEYHGANQDLPRSNFDAFLHFVTAGYLEGRRMTASELGFEEAAERMAQIRNIKRDGESGFVGLALPMTRIGRRLEAEVILQDGMKLFGKSDKLLRELAFSAMYCGLHDVAISRWSEFRSLFPDKVDGYRFEAFSLRQNGSIFEAERIIRIGLQRFPNDMHLGIELAELAVCRHDWEQASDLWYSLLNRFPNNQEIRDRAGDTAFRLRLWRSEQPDVDVDAMDGPVVVRMSEEETAKVLDELGLTDTKELKSFFMHFESLGHSCEFGIVQRRYGAEPISLLRWNSITLQNLTRGFKTQFKGISDLENLILLEARREFILKDLTYETVMHTFTYRGETDPQQFREKLAKRMEFLRQKLLSDLDDGDKIFVFLDDQNHSDNQIEDLRLSFCSYGNKLLLLYVRVADAGSKIGTVEPGGDGLLFGYLERLGRMPDGSWYIDFESWLSVCRLALAAKLKTGSAVIEKATTKAIDNEFR